MIGIGRSKDAEHAEMCRRATANGPMALDTAVIYSGTVYTRVVYTQADYTAADCTEVGRTEVDTRQGCTMVDGETRYSRGTASGGEGRLARVVVHV